MTPPTPPPSWKAGVSSHAQSSSSSSSSSSSPSTCSPSSSSGRLRRVVGCYSLVASGSSRCLQGLLGAAWTLPMCASNLCQSLAPHAYLLLRRLVRKGRRPTLAAPKTKRR
eukprot:GHVT01075370.1.p1 GENE.GHVT01075370.1~~GHVT01075370.1.p1  ORF type:complete len:111 (-),score=31.81 GHVT01075370.1:1152-1484(-)